jgi:hypothetical protein
MQYPRPTNQQKLYRKKKYHVILPGSAIDNGQDRELVCMDTGSEARKRYHQNSIPLFFFFDYQIVLFFPD